QRERGLRLVELGLRPRRGGLRLGLGDRQLLDALARGGLCRVAGLALLLEPPLVLLRELVERVFERRGPLLLLVARALRLLLERRFGRVELGVGARRQRLRLGLGDGELFDAPARGGLGGVARFALL